MSLTGRLLKMIVVPILFLSVIGCGKAPNASPGASTLMQGQAGSDALGVSNAAKTSTRIAN
jgi:hypothetical protein